MDWLYELLPQHLPLWAGFAALLALIYTAIVDARTGLVPPWPLIGAGIIVVIGWLFAAPEQLPAHVIAAFLVYGAIWSLNMLWRSLYKHDALGMGDASWSWLAALAYSWPFIVAAWGGGAILALLFLATRKAIGKPATHVYFAPFLCVALLLARLTQSYL